MNVIPKQGKTWLYSWVMNNYWTTNFRAFQEGGFSWKQIRSHQQQIQPNTLLRNMHGVKEIHSRHVHSRQVKMN